MLRKKIPIFGDFFFTHCDDLFALLSSSKLNQANLCRPNSNGEVKKLLC